MAKKRKTEPEPEVEEEDGSGNETGSDGDADQQQSAPDEDMNEAISSEEEDEDNVAPAESTPLPVIKSSITSDGRYHNKQRLLMLSSRGITARYRHLLEDLRTLVPHSKKESKLDVGKDFMKLCTLLILLTNIY